MTTARLKMGTAQSISLPLLARIFINLSWYDSTTTDLFQKLLDSVKHRLLELVPSLC